MSMLAIKNPQVQEIADQLQEKCKSVIESL